MGKIRNPFRRKPPPPPPPPTAWEKLQAQVTAVGPAGLGAALVVPIFVMLYLVKKPGASSKRNPRKRLGSPMASPGFKASRGEEQDAARLVSVSGTKSPLNRAGPEEARRRDARARSRSDSVDRAARRARRPEGPRECVLRTS